MKRLFALSFLIAPLVFIGVSVVFWLLIGAIFGLWWIGAIFGLLLALVLTLVGFWRADSIVLAVTRAREASADDYPRLHNVVDGLCVSVGLAKPNVFVIDDVAPNAFVFGATTSESSIAFTTGLLNLLDRIELEAVVAQLLGRIRSGQVAHGTRAAILVGAPLLLADALLRRRWWNSGRVARDGDPSEKKDALSHLGSILLVTARPISWIMSAAVGKDRDIASDLAACHLTRYPPGLIRALEKLQNDCTVTHSGAMATAHLWFAEPLSGVGDAGRQAKLHNLFSVHSSLDERIALLKEM